MLTAGKLSPLVLERAVLSHLRELATAPSCIEAYENVVVPASQGEDAAVLRLSKIIPDSSDNLIVVGADPITGANDPELAGSLAVFVNGNDVLVQGGMPEWMTLTLLVPVGTEEDTLARVVLGVVRAAKVLGMVVVGGHTEVTDAVNKIVVAGTMLGSLHPKLEGRPVLTGGLRLGDSVLLTKSAALEGTAILLTDRRDYLLAEKVFFKALWIWRKSLLLIHLTKFRYMLRCGPCCLQLDRTCLQCMIPPKVALQMRSMK